MDASRRIGVQERRLCLQGALGPQVTVFLSDVETDVWADGTLANLTQQSARWLVTRGELGADEHTAAGMLHLPPHKVCLPTAPVRSTHPADEALSAT